MKIQREWATPLTIGSFVLIAVTGVLMFFHLDSGLNKAAHEWLSWLLLAGVLLHVTSNWLGFKRYFGQPRGRLLIGALLLVLGLSFIPFGGGEGGDEPPFVAPVKALAAAPLPVLAQVAQVSPDEMRQRLRAAGLQPQSDSDSLAKLAGGDTRRQVQLLRRVLAPAGAGRG